MVAESNFAPNSSFLTPLLSKFSGHKDCVYALCEGPKPGDFFSSGADGMVVLWNVNEPENGHLVAKVDGTVYALLYLHDKNQILITVNRHGFHLVDLESDTEVWSWATPLETIFRLGRWKDQIWASASIGMVYRVDIEKQTVERNKVGNSDLRALALNPTNPGIAFGSSDQHLYWQSFLYPELPMHSWKAHENTVFGLQFYPSGDQLISVGRDAQLKLWSEASSGKFELEKSVPAHLFGIHDVVLHPSKPILATGSMDKTIKIWDAETLKLLRVLDKTRHAGHGHAVNQLLWLTDQEVLLSCSDDRTISAWNIFE